MSDKLGNIAALGVLMPVIAILALASASVSADPQASRNSLLSPQDHITPLDAPLPENEITRITCQYDGTIYHYDLYIPQEYYSDLRQRYPVVFITSPVGDATMENSEEWIRSRRWIAVMLIEARNGPWGPILGNFYAAHDDVVQRVRINERMKFASGFSGGARASAAFTTRRPGFRGVIEQGAGEWSPALVFAAFGSGDYNLGELEYLKWSIPPGRLSYEVFDGGHEWAPAETINRAFEWFLATIPLEHSISGQVFDSNGLPLADVEIPCSCGVTTVTFEDGWYSFTRLFSGTYVLTPTLSGATFWPPVRAVSVPPDAYLQDFAVVAAPVSTVLTPNVSSTLSYTDPQGLPTILAFPPNAVSQMTTVVLTPNISRAGPGFAFAWHAFELVALQGGTPQPDLTFGAPVTVTIHYSAQNVRLVSDHSQLRLYGWIGNEWQGAAETCTPALPYTLDVEQRILSVPICHPGQFAIFGPTRSVYLPMIFHKY